MDMERVAMQLTMGMKPWKTGAAGPFNPVRNRQVERATL